MKLSRALVVGGGVGILVFLQGVLIFYLPIRISWLQIWALTCGGMFGLTLSSAFANPAEATQHWRLPELVFFFSTARQASH